MRTLPLIGRLRRRAAWVLDRRVQMVVDEIGTLREELREVSAAVAALQDEPPPVVREEVRALSAEVSALRAEVSTLRDQLPPVLRAI